MNDLVALRRGQVDSGPKHLVEVLWATTRDSSALLSPCCLTRSPAGKN